MASYSRSLRARFETLEQRQLLAGDVVLHVVGGNLIVRGDAADNQIMVTSGAEIGTFVVTGLEGTTVHRQGQPAGADPVTVAGIRNIEVGLGAGDDLVAVVGANVRGGLAIRAGVGDDRVLVGTGGDAAELVGQLPSQVAVRVDGGVAIGTNGGLDQVSVDNAMIGRVLSIHTGTENDTVSLGTATDDDLSARLHVRAGVHVDLGHGDDELNIHQLNTGGGVVAYAGSGDDTLDASRIHAAAMLLLTDGGADTVALTELNVQHFALHTGAGDDHVDIRDSAFSTFGVALDDGNDSLTTSALEARLAVLLGGPGADTLEVLSENHFLHKLILGF